MFRKAYSYVRFSTKQQAKGDSLRRQNEATEAFCERHKLVLDASLSFADLGVSAFKGKNRDEGALAAFIDAVQSGRVALGSVLVVEALDRLSRDRLRPALIMALQLIEAGITIATITPERFYDPKSTDDISLVEMLLGFVRANEESSTKSVRVKQAYRNRLSEAKNGNKLLTKRLPAWLRVGDSGKPEVIPERAKIIRDIFDMATRVGSRAIAKELNRRGVKPFGRGKAWGWAYVQLLLADGRVLGHHKETATGKTLIADYLPRIVSDEAYEIVKNLRGKRGKHGNWRGQIGKRVTNLFQGLLWDVDTEGTLTTIRKGKGKPARLIPSAYENGSRGHAKSFQYDVAEDLLLISLFELSSADVAPAKFKTVNRLPSLQADLAKTETRLREIEASLAESDYPIAALLKATATLEAKRAAILAEVDKERERQRTTTGELLGVTKSVIELLRTAKADEVVPLRLKLRSAIRNLVERINCRISQNTAKGWYYTLEAEIVLRNGIKRTVDMTTKRGQLVAIRSNPPSRTAAV